MVHRFDPALAWGRLRGVARVTAAAVVREVEDLQVDLALS